MSPSAWPRLAKPSAWTLLGALVLTVWSLTVLRPTAAQGTPPGALPAGLSPAEWQTIQSQLPPTQTYLKAANANAGDYFGAAVAISGDTMVVGAPWEDSGWSDPTDNTAAKAGAAYVFVRANGTWSQQAYLKAANAGAGDWFGYSVAITGDLIAVGAIGEASNGSTPTDNSANAAGAVYVFVRSSVDGTATWSQQAYLKAANAGAGDEFGIALDLDPTTLVVGAEAEDSNGSGPGNNSATDAGAAYVFVSSTIDGTTTWSQQAYLKAANPDAHDEFGWSVRLDGDTVIVGAPRESSNGSGPGDNSATDAGAAYVFVRSDTVWSQQGYLKAEQVGAADAFGFSVDMAGDTVIVGALREDSNGSGPGDNSASRAGAAYVFVRANGTWSQQAYLKAANAGAGDEFGQAVAITGDTVLIGAALEDSDGSGPANNSASDAGAAYVFVRTNGSWGQQDYLKAGNAGANDRFGQAVHLTSTTMGVGAVWEASNGSSPTNNSASQAGAAYVFSALDQPTPTPTLTPPTSTATPVDPTPTIPAPTDTATPVPPTATPSPLTRRAYLPVVLGVGIDEGMAP